MIDPKPERVPTWLELIGTLATILTTVFLAVRVAEEFSILRLAGCVVFGVVSCQGLLTLWKKSRVLKSQDA